MRKIDMDSSLTTYKARLVAKGYTQIQEIDFDETFLRGCHDEIYSD